MQAKDIKKELIKQGYKVKSVEVLKEGASRESFLVKTDQKYVLRLRTKDRKAKLQREISNLRKINKIKKIIINPIASKPLDLGDHVAYMYEYLPGTTLNKAKIKNKLEYLGEIHGEFSKITKKISKSKPSNKYFLDNWKIGKYIGKEYSHRKDKYWRDLGKTVNKGLEFIKRDYDKSKLPAQIGHGDLHMDNIIYHKGKYTIIDTSGVAHNNTRANEVAVVLSYEINENNAHNKKIIRKFMKGYNKYTKLTKKELKLIPPIMIFRLFGEILWVEEQHYKKNKLTRKEMVRIMNSSHSKFKRVLKQYENLRKIFS